MIYDPHSTKFSFPRLDERIAVLTERIERRKREADGMAEMRAMPGFVEHATGLRSSKAKAPCAWCGSPVDGFGYTHEICMRKLSELDTLLEKLRQPKRTIDDKKVLKRITVKHENGALSIDDATPEEWDKASRSVNKPVTDWLTPRGDVLHADADGWYQCTDYCPCDPEMHVEISVCAGIYEPAMVYKWGTLSANKWKWRPHKAD